MHGKEGTPYDWWRDSNVRYLGYVNEFGEAFRPLVPKQAVWASYVVALGYAAGDASDKTKREFDAGSTTKKSCVIGGCAALWQLLASVTIPAYFVNKQVALTARLTPPRPSLRLLPTVSGLCLIPFLPYVLDPPITTLVDSIESALLA